jgi:hypothetical protein
VVIKPEPGQEPGKTRNKSASATADSGGGGGGGGGGMFFFPSALSMRSPQAQENA